VKLLVTGGAGFIGSAVVRRAVAEGHKVTTLDALTYAACLANLDPVKDSPRHRFVRGDIRDRALLDDLLAEVRPDAVMHLAAESHVDRSIDGPATFIETNVMGTFHLLEAARAFWQAEGRPGDFRFHHVSTDEVYGSLGPEGQFTEDTPYDPRSPYSASKAGSDHLVMAWHHTYGLPVLLTNCSNNYGPYQFPEKLIPLMILNALDGRELPIYGDGMNVRDWLYVRDHCEAIREVFLRGRVGEIYNVGGLNEQPNIRIVEQICGLLDELSPKEGGDSYASQKIFVTDRPGHDRRYAIDCTKIRDELGWTPREDFASGLRKTVNWYLENRNWCDEITQGRYKRQRLGSV